MDKEYLRKYLSTSYQGGQSFLDTIIIPIFGNNFEHGYNKEVLQGSNDKRLATSTGIRSIRLLGSVYVGIEPLQVFDITVSDSVKMERNRVSIQRLIRSVMSSYSAAFLIFHYEDTARWDWRFTFCRKEGSLAETTDSKRYTFLLGPGQSCRTATDNFYGLYSRQEPLTMEDLQQAFSVEALSREFFQRYKSHYETFVSSAADPENGLRGHLLPEEQEISEEGAIGMREEEKPIRDYVKKLLGRIVFLHFLQKKGWMGVPRAGEWGEGDKDFMLHLFEYASPEQQANFLDSVLEPLFTEALDTDRRQYQSLFDTRVDGIGVVRVPYLNGGLFERDALDERQLAFPAEYFRDLLSVLSQYNFTIDENDPNDAEVGIDPEMLGRIFENLLEDNKDMGAFYTPKEIVRYMCAESLIAYLQSDHEDEDERQAIRVFVESHDGTSLGDLTEEIRERLLRVKICDPAIGSGAFPMGLLRELYFCRSALDPANAQDPAATKREILQNNIYGVDLERGAVDIARLRFWLTLVVDERTPEALPNLDFKIMQGDSLLEQYESVDLSTLTKTKSEIDLQQGCRLTLFEDNLDPLRYKLSHLIQEYYACDDHTMRLSMRREITTMIELQLREQQFNVSLGDIDVHANDKFFLWHTWFGDVFIENGGFDIVIGNPPYIQLSKDSGRLAKLYADVGYDTYARTGDIYCLFYELGWRLLRDGGHLCYITSNKWMRAGYGEKTRQFLSECTNPRLLIDFAGVKIFQNATVDTNILLFAKEKNSNSCRSVVSSKSDRIGVDNLSVFVQQHATPSAFTSAPWVILTPIEQRIKEKIEAVGTPLKDWDIQIYRGVLTGCNEAFIIDTAKRDEILANCQTEEERQRSEDLIRPILRGRDIKRYGYEDNGLYLINTHNGTRGKIPRIDINDYPAVKAHLDQYWDEISVRADKGDTPYNLRNCAYLEDFNKPKIVWGEISDRSKFAYEPRGEYMTEATTFLMVGTHLPYLFCILNSPLSEWFFSKVGTTTGVGTVRWKKFTIQELLIPRISESEEQIFSSLVQRLIAREVSINEFSCEVNSLVYALVGLSSSEINYIQEYCMSLINR